MNTKIAGILLALGLVISLNHVPPARSAPAASGPALGTLSGRVTRDDGSPAAGISVTARSTRYVTSAPEGEAVTDADGRYKITLDTHLSPQIFGDTAGEGDTQFTVTVEGQEPLFAVPPSEAVTLPENLTRTGVDFRLTTGPQITVHVRDFQSGQPVPGVSVKYLENTDYSNNYLEAAVTNAQGNAVFRVPSLSVRLSLVPPGGNTPAIRTAAGSQFYREVRLTQIQDITWDVLTDPTTPPTTPTVWRGMVLTADGQPADGAKVSVLRGEAEAKTVTDKQGGFTVSLPPLTEQEYNQFQGVAFLVEKGNQSAVVVPTPDATQGGMVVRLTLKPLGSYAGTVVGPDGSPEANVSVTCRGGLTAAEGVGLDRAVMTDALGRFRLSGLPAGKYQVNLGGGAFGLVTLPPSDPGYPYSNMLLTLGDGEQHDFGHLTLLPADEIVAGQIVDASGTPVSGRLMAIVHGAHTNQTASLDTDGRFRVYHVVREPLTLDLYRSEPSGGFSLGQTSPDLFLKVPVSAGREDVRVVLPPGALPLPSLAPVPATPSGPPHVSAVFGLAQIAGLWLNYNPEGSASDPQLTHIHAWLETQMAAQVGPGTPWQGSLADMDGMQLVLKNYQGTLKDRAGHTLWTGPLGGRPEPAAYTVVSDTAKPGLLILLDRRGHTLWSGPFIAKVPPVQTLDGDLVVIGPAGRIVWQQPAVSGPIRYRVLDHGRPGPYDDVPKPPDGVIHFAAAPRRAVFRTLDGKVFYSGSLLILLLTVTDNAKPTNPLRYDAQSLSWVPRIIFPFWTPGYRGGMKYDLYDPSGKIIQTSTMQPQ